MPLTQKGKTIEREMVAKYGEKKGRSVLYASKNAGTITGIDRAGNIGARSSRDSHAGTFVGAGAIKGRDLISLGRRR